MPHCWKSHVTAHLSLAASVSVPGYRLMYLIVRLEQQQDHMRDVITSTRNYGNRQSLKLITKIKDALSKLYGTMLSIRDDDEAVYNQIGTSINDLDEFFNMVENVCSAVEDIPVERKWCFEEQSTYFHRHSHRNL